MMSGPFALGLFAQIGLIAHFPALLVPRLGEAGAAATISLSTASAVVGRMPLGWLLGSRDRRAAAAINFLVQAGGVALIAVPAARPAVAIVGCILFGLGIGNLVSLPPLIAQAEFERLDVPLVVALAVAVNRAVFAFAPGAFGALYAATGGYAAPLILAASLQIVAAALIMIGRNGRGARHGTPFGSGQKC